MPEALSHPRVCLVDLVAMPWLDCGFLGLGTSGSAHQRDNAIPTGFVGLGFLDMTHGTDLRKILFFV